MALVQAIETYVEAGRRQQIHRRVALEGVAVLVGTERCNLDETDEETAPYELDLEDAKAAAASRFCGHCFPDGKPMVLKEG
jgi:hypothetical protein